MGICSRGIGRGSERGVWESGRGGAGDVCVWIG